MGLKDLGYGLSALDSGTQEVEIHPENFQDFFELLFYWLSVNEEFLETVTEAERTSRQQEAVVTDEEGSYRVSLRPPDFFDREKMSEPFPGDFVIRMQPQENLGDVRVIKVLMSPEMVRLTRQQVLTTIEGLPEQPMQ